jgi:hypothetical protein
MASKKPVVSSKKPVAAPAKVVASTPVRNTPVPKTPAKVAMKKEITHGEIAKRAYEIWQSGKGGSEYDNWIRAERELRGL